MALRRDIFLFLFLGLCLGAWLSFSLVSLRTVLVAVTIFILGFLAFKRGRPVLYLYLLGLVIGFCLLLIRLPSKSGEGDYSGIVVLTKGNYFLFLSGGCRYYVYERETAREIGDILTIHGSSYPYESIPYESRFDFGSYLKTLGVSNALSLDYASAKWSNPIRLRSYELSYLSKFPSSPRAFIDSLLFGKKDYQDSLIAEASSLGCLYLLSSGGIIYGAVFRLVEKVLSLRLSERKTRIVSLLICALFLPLNYAKVGFWRIYLGRLYKAYLSRKGETPPALYVTALSGITIISCCRYAPLDTGFLLGYGLSITMSLSQSLLSRYRGRKKSLASKKLLFSFLFPSLVSGGAIHLLSFVYASILLPFTLGFLLIAFFGFLTLPPVRLLTGYALAISSFLGFLAKIDVVIPLGSLSELFVYAYYLCYYVALYFSDCGLAFSRNAVVASLALAATLNAMPFGQGLSEEVDFVNVGQGDCIVIRKGYDVAMIDTGSSLSFDMAEQVDIPYLRKRRIYNVDCLIASHGDFDHIGAASSLMEHFKVRKYVDSLESFPLDVGGLHFENLNIYGLTSENEKSLVITLTLMDRKWMFTGDAPISVESRILLDNPSLDCDILKVGHHGSKTSSSYAWLKTLSPEVAIVSVGKRNSYGHPDAEVIERLSKLGIKTRRTDEEGTISFYRFKGLPIREGSAFLPLREPEPLLLLKG